MSEPVRATPPVAVIGGSGLYHLFDDDTPTVVDVRTPYGAVRLTRGFLGGHDTVFLPRHGSDHSVPPHAIPSRATIWALASLGVRVLISTAAVGSLNPDLPIGTTPASQAPQQKRQLDVDAWLRGRGHPVVAPSPLAPTEPVARQGRPAALGVR